MEIGLPDTHNCIRGRSQDNSEFHKDGDFVNVYFASKGETWQVTFKDVKITGYAKSIEFPFSSDKDYLEAVFISAEKYLYEHLLPNVAKCKLQTMKDRHVEIKELERKLRTMKGLV